MDAAAAPASDLERRKQVRLRRRSDLNIVPQRYEGRMYYVVKDPVNLRYYRFKEQEHYLLNLMDGSVTLDAAQKSFEGRFPPERLRLEDLEQFGQQLLQTGLVQNESPRRQAALRQSQEARPHGVDADADEHPLHQDPGLRSRKSPRPDAPLALVDVHPAVRGSPASASC